MTAHPRSRGENIGRVTSRSRLSGSSPLTRGKRVRCLDRQTAERLIPAHAGKTPKSGRPPSWRTAHPRSRGENIVLRTGSRTVSGSSPLTRGKRTCPETAAAHERLIPAHAGKTLTLPTRVAMSAAHPRSRGENETAGRRKDRPSGSSPLTRGKPRTRRAWVAPSRLIPAHAGKTSRPGRWTGERPAHPRSRGENSVMFDLSKLVSGSSPLTRGKPGTVVGKHPRERLIPAHAGKTTTYSVRFSRRAAHPRSRGENTS